MTGGDRPRIAVSPGVERSRRRRLFDALEAAFHVSFEPFEPASQADWSGAIVVRAGGDGAADEPSAPARVATFVAHEPAGERGSRRSTRVHFSSSSAVDGRLRGRTLVEEEWPVTPPLDGRDAGSVLASGPDGGLWSVDDVGGVTTHSVTCLPPELESGERLKSRLQAGRFLALLPLVQFLREVTGASEWVPPARTACLVLDDPNLHWPSYGFVNYRQLADHATSHGYHMSIATVPLDAAYADRRAVEVFRSSPTLSLSVHGNNHLKRELAQSFPESATVAVAAQALRRVAAFERRHGLEVDRVMIPPHTSVSVPMMRAMLRVGFEAICFEGPVGSGSDDALIGWNPADVHVAGGLPGLHRHYFGCSPEELVLRGFLDHPLILAGHHGDLAPNLDALASSAAAVNDVADVRWTSLAGVARANYLLRRSDALLEIRPFARVVDVDLPEEVSRLRVSLPPMALDHDQAVTVEPIGEAGDRRTVPPGESFAVRGGGSLRLRVGRPADVAPESVPSPPWAPWPLLRRGLVSGRDRLAPVLRRR